MANEFKHADVGTELTKLEWESIACHIADGQARGDILYFNGTYWVRLPAGTPGQALKTQGAGANPAWGAAAAGLTFTELAGGEGHQVTNTSTWEDWDLSAIVPAGTKAVLVEIYLQFSANQVSGVRKNGSSLNRYQSTGTPTNTVVSFRNILTEVDGNRIIEIYGSLASAYLTFSILGYWS